MPGVVPWSYSSLQSFETCPRRHYLTKISKVVVEPTTPALAGGRAVHKAMEDGVNGKVIPEAYFGYKPIINRIRAAPGQKQTERKWGLDRNLHPVDFFAKDVWVRGVLDLTIVHPTMAIVIDYKTGKVKQDSDQLKLFAAAGFAMYPFAEKIKTGYMWLDHDKITDETYLRQDTAPIWQEFMPRIERMKRVEADGNWEPCPSGLCGWCPVGKQHCEFWKGYRGENR